MDELERALREQVPAILRTLAGTSVEELRLERGDTRVTVRRSAGDAPPVAHAEAPAANSAAPELNTLAAAGQVEVRAQVVGLFHRARETDGPALAQEGERVEDGRAIGVIETLGIASDVVAPVAGRLAKLVAQDGQAMEYGALVAVIDPE